MLKIVPQDRDQERDPKLPGVTDVRVVKDVIP